MRQLLGGSFAPPITPDKLVEYEQLAETQTGEVKDAMQNLCKMVSLFQQTPESKLEGSAHPSGVGTVVPLEQAEIDRIWDLVPWPYECDAMGVVFESLTGPVRNAAYHLLWYARELAADREPITTDRIR